MNYHKTYPSTAKLLEIEELEHEIAELRRTNEDDSLLEEKMQCLEDAKREYDDMLDAEYRMTRR